MILLIFVFNERERRSAAGSYWIVGLQNPKEKTAVILFAICWTEIQYWST
jgi:hypothetical protein